MAETKKSVPVPINTSCPNCFEPVTVNMNLNKEQPNTIKRIQEATGVELGVLGVYAFDGYVVCPKCGKVVLASLTVSAHDKSKIPS